MEFNLADLFENAVDHFAENECIVANGQRRTYGEMEARANRLAHHLARAGIKPGDHVGIYALNCVEWVETLWAVFKIRAVWININYRYVEDELRYIFDNADLKALVYAREFAPRVAAVRSAMPDVKHSIVIEDGSNEDTSGLDSIEYEAAMAEGSPERDFAPRSPDDHYILYTGGTTGMPKGVVWRHEDVFFALGGGIDAASGWKAKCPEDMIKKAEDPGPHTFFSIAPLMHGATQWSVMSRSFVGCKNVLTAKFEPHAVWKLVESEKVDALMITGDAMGRPLVEALDEKPDYQVEHLFLLTSTAAVFSPTVKDDFFRHLPNLIMIDGVGASEAGNNGMRMITKGNTAMIGGGPTFKPGEGTVVLGENLRPLAPGSGEVGKIARSGHIPLEYYKDPKKTAETFFTAPDGVRYSMPGDFASLEADGTITLKGRGSVSINSGGEKIFPEEVEQAVKSHPQVFDAVVIGVPDERWGTRVAAVVELRPGDTALALEDLKSHCRTQIAGYKLPRQLNLVPAMERSPAGKPDYRWAKRIALGEIEA